MLTIHNLKVSTSCCALLYIICTCFTAYSWDLLLPKIQPQKIVLVFLLREFHGQRSLAGYSPWGHKESDMTDSFFFFTFSLIIEIWNYFPILFKNIFSFIFQFSHSVMSDSLRPHGLQPTRLPCPLPTPGTCSNSCPSSQWCQLNNSSSAVSFSSCLQFFPASVFSRADQFFASSGQNIRDISKEISLF